MKFSSLFRVELGRLFRSRLTWAVLGITAAAPAVGFTFYCPLSGSLNSTALANPALGGSLAGALIFALLTVLEPVSYTHLTASPAGRKLGGKTDSSFCLYQGSIKEIYG